jgi:hypothetical protein
VKSGNLLITINNASQARRALIFTRVKHRIARDVLLGGESRQFRLQNSVWEVSSSMDDDTILRKTV